MASEMPLAITKIMAVGIAREKRASSTARRSGERITAASGTSAPIQNATTMPCTKTAGLVKKLRLGGAGMTAHRERNAHACQRQSWEQSATHPPHGDAAEH